MKSTFAAAASVLAFAVSVSAQLPPGLLNPALPAECSSLLTPTFIKAAGACGLAELAPAFSSVGNGAPPTPAQTSALLTGLVNSPTFLPAMCGAECSAVLTEASTKLTAACGNTPLLGANVTGNEMIKDEPMATAFLAKLTANDAVSIVSYVRKGVCTKNGAEFCTKTLVTATNGMLTEDVWEKQVCTPCGKIVIDEINKTEGLPVELGAYLKTETAPLAAKVAACPAGSTAAAAATAPSGAASNVVGASFAGAAAAVAAMILA
ncbi:hypothetical protein DFJ77DRAFT_515299 [Powellomyces hirtus]|nr:hypothetical protein DFJ77DRAFT_515299 [Powellomyces hirtus]